MKWSIRFTEEGRKALDALDKPARKRVETYLRDRVLSSGDPRSVGKALRFGMAGLWRYRVGDYRVLCKLLDKELIVLVVAAGHRSRIYGD